MNVSKPVFISVILLSILSGVMISQMLSVMAFDGGGNPFDMIWEAIYDLQSRVTSLEQSNNDKTWNLVTDFTLSPEEQVSPLFFIQGEKWRINWEPTVVGVWYAFIIFDENGYVIDNLDLLQVVYRYLDAKGIYYVHQGEGNYYIEVVTEGANVNFTIESYH